MAEGVEQLEDWRLLQALQCDMVQGSFAAKPMPAEELVDWWHNNQARLKAL